MKDEARVRDMLLCSAVLEDQWKLQWLVRFDKRVTMSIPYLPVHGTHTLSSTKEKHIHLVSWIYT